MSWWYESEDEALAEAKRYIDTTDPEGKIMNISELIYNEAMDSFWDKFNNLKNDSEMMVDKEWETIEANEELLTNIVWDKLRKY